MSGWLLLGLPGYAYLAGMEAIWIALGLGIGTYLNRKKMGFSKSTLHYMKKNTEADKPFTLNAHVRERLEMWERLTLQD